MGNFIEDRARQSQIAESAMDGVRIIRADELTRIKIALSSATDALMRAKSSERTAQALCEINEAQCLIGGITLTDDRRPPAEFAPYLETQTRVVAPQPLRCGGGPTKLANRDNTRGAL